MAFKSNIQILRAFASLNVVLFHIIDASKAYGQPVVYLDFLSGWGLNGVDLFFVISGFIMIYIQHQKPRNSTAFLVSRIKRIVPVYFVLTAFVILLASTAPYLFNEIRPRTDWVICSFSFSCIHVTDGDPILYLGWTLEYEMMFYAVFSMALLSPSKWLQILVILIALFIANTLGGYSSLVYEFMFGMMAAYAYLYVRKIPLSSSYIVATALMAFTLFCLPLVYDTGLDRVVIYGLPAFFLVFSAALLPQIKSDWPIYLGNASYSIYLAQALSIPAFYKISAMSSLQFNGDALALGCFVATALAGCAVYELIEQTVARHLSNQKPKSGPLKQ